MRDNHLIHPGRAVQEGKVQPKGSLTNNQHAHKETYDNKGDMLICNLWQRGIDSIHDIRAVNTDALHHHNKLTENYPLTAKNEKRRKYLEA